jgi:AcrR family transcriptional regulator
MSERVDNRSWRQADTLSRRRAARDARGRLIDGLTRVAGSGEGFADTNVAGVIAAAGASRSTFYETFPDLESSMHAALQATGEQLAGELELALMAAPEPDPAGTAVTALVGFAEAHPEPARLLFLESLGAGTGALAVRDGLIDRLAGLVEAARAGAGPAGHARDAALDVPALALLGGVFRLLSMRLPRGEAALHGLAEDLLAWANSYAVDAQPPQWLEGGPLGHVELRLPPGPKPVSPPGPLPRGRHKLSQTEIARHQRERIVQALARESYERGYSAVTVTDIVKRAGISRNVFYDQFPDKQQAAIAALRQTFEHAMVATASSFFAGDTWPERIWRMGGALTDHYYAHPVEAHLSFVELHAIGGEGITLAHERLNVFTLLLEEGYRQRPDGPPLPRTTSEALVATVLELGYRQAPRPGVERYPILLPQQTYMCLAPFLGARRASELVQDWLAG